MRSTHLPTASLKYPEDEIPDFSNIQENLEKVSRAIEALQLWVEKEVPANQN